MKPSLTLFIFLIFCQYCYAKHEILDESYKHIRLAPQNVVITIPKDSFVYFEHISAETHGHTLYEIKIDDNTSVDVSITPYDGAYLDNEEYAAIEYGDLMENLNNTRLKHNCMDDICSYRITSIMMTIWYRYPKEKYKESEHFIHSIRPYDESITLSEPDKTYNPTLQARLFFNFNDYTIDEKHHQLIKNMCDILNNESKLKLGIRSSSTSDEDKDIAKNRVNEVIKKFSDCGIEKSRINIREYFIENVQSSDDDTSRQAQRRINLNIYNSP